MPYQTFQHVKILPWVGKNHQNGGGIFRQRTIILGGSQYSPGYENFHSDEGQDEWKGFTQEVVDYYFDDQIQGRWKATYTTFINSVFGGQSDVGQRGRFFDSIIFYNYLQEIAGNSASGAGNYDYKSPQHFAAFQEILSQYQPEVVISWGAKVWEALPNNWGTDEAVIGDPVIVDGRDAGRVYTYPFQNKTIRLVGVRHPSIGYDVKFHYSLFKQIDLLA